MTDYETISVFFIVVCVGDNCTVYDSREKSRILQIV